MLKKTFLLFFSIVLITACSNQISTTNVDSTKPEFLFVNNSQVTVHSSETVVREIGKLNQSKHLFAYNDNYLIFLDNELFLSSFNIENKEVKKLPISSVSPEYGGYNSGFVVENGVLYFLRGGCGEVYSCDLYSFDIKNNKEVLLQKNIGFLKHGGLGIHSFNKENNSLILISSMGDGGIAKMEVYEFNLDKKELNTMSAYEGKYCGENNEFCNQNDEEKNKLYEDAYNKFVKRPEVVTCSGKQINTENKGRFVSCV